LLDEVLDTVSWEVIFVDDESPDAGRAKGLLHSEESVAS
jgi:hypothetical protein